MLVACCLQCRNIGFVSIDLLSIGYNLYRIDIGTFLSFGSSGLCSFGMAVGNFNSTLHLLSCFLSFSSYCFYTFYSSLISFGLDCCFVGSDLCATSLQSIGCSQICFLQSNDVFI